MEKLKINSLVASELGLNPSTLRKYVKLLEDFNYPIKKNLQGQRLYSEENIQKIREFIGLIAENKWSLTKAAQLVTLEYQEETLEVVVEKLIERINAMEKKLGIHKN